LGFVSLKTESRILSAEIARRRIPISFPDSLSFFGVLVDLADATRRPMLDGRQAGRAHALVL
jgi:hypothetical protein